jgi:hypothetical protein
MTTQPPRSPVEEPVAEPVVGAIERKARADGTVERWRLEEIEDKTAEEEIRDRIRLLQDELVKCDKTDENEVTRKALEADREMRAAKKHFIGVEITNLEAKL